MSLFPNHIRLILADIDFRSMEIFGVNRHDTAVAGIQYVQGGAIDINIRWGNKITHPQSGSADYLIGLVNVRRLHHIAIEIIIIGYIRDRGRSRQRQILWLPGHQKDRQSTCTNRLLHQASPSFMHVDALNP